MDVTMDAVEVMDVTTTDRERAREVLRAGFPGLELDAAEHGPSFEFSYRRVADDFFSINQLSLAGRAESRGEFPNVLAAGRVRGGRFSLEYGTRTVDTSAPYLRPAGHHLARLEGTSIELLAVDPMRFAQLAAHHLAGTGAVLRAVTPDRATPVSSEAADLWRLTADYIYSVSTDRALFEHPLVRASLVDLFVSTMLTVFPLTDTVADTPSAGVPTRALQRAVQYMEEHIGEPITTPMIADAARLSVRGLQNGFATRLGTTPLRHLRQLRLQAVHEELVRAGRHDGLTVEGIARRWGFTHLGRFAASYRDTFGRLPSTDLRG